MAFAASLRQPIEWAIYVKGWIHEDVCDMS